MTTAYTPKRATKPLRILMQNRSATFSARGGDTVVLEQLRDGLIARGCLVSVDITGHEDPRNYDIVHLFNFATPESTRAQAEAAVKAGTPFVVTTLYEEVPEFHNQSQAIAGRLKEYVARQQDRSFWEKYKLNLSLIPRAPRFDNDWTASHAAALFVNGESEKRAVERDYPRSKTPTVVHLGHEVAAMATSEAFEREYGLRDFVLCVGRFESRKNQLMLLKALEKSDLTVVFASGGFTYQPDYAQAIHNFKRKGKTVVLDRLSPAMLASAYAACRVHVLPSWFELPGLVSLEAAAYGKNIVATKTGTTADYLGDTAYYCLPWDEDSIEAAVTAAYYAPPKPGLQEMAARWSWNATIDETLTAYEEVLGIRAQSATLEQPVKEIEIQKNPTPLYDMSSEAAEMQEALERGELAAKDGQFELAVRLLTKAEALNPTSARVLKALGAVYLATSDAPKALGYFERALKIAPNDTKVLTGRGMCEVLTTKYADAIPYFERALEADATHLVAIHQLLRCAYETNVLDSAERALIAYLERKPEDSSMRFCLAGCHYRQGKHQQALEEITQVIKDQPEDSTAQDLKALIEFALSSNASVETSPSSATTASKQEVSQETVVSPTFTDINDSLADLSKRIAEWKVGGEVVSAPAKAPEVEPTAPVMTQAPSSTVTPPIMPVQTGPVGSSPGEGYIESRLNMVDDLRRDRKVKDARAAFEAVRHAVGMSPKQSARAKCLEAEFLVLDGELVAADALYTELLQNDGRNARALCGKGALAAEGQKWSEARRFFEEALASQPGYDVALAGLGLCEMVGNNGETAFELFQKAAKANPENQRALLGVMQVGYPLKKYREIEELLTTYLDLHPASVDMLYSFAGVLFAQGKMQQARMEVEKILLFEPANTRALELRKMIETGKSSSATVPAN